MRQKVEVITKPNIVKMVEVFYNLLKMIFMVQSWITAFLVCKRPPQLDPKQHEVFADGTKDTKIWRKIEQAADRN